MVNVLGITHLDFILITHAHSDHIGGLFEIANTKADGHCLADANTVYFYKEYKPVNKKNDILWHNIEFTDLAISTMSEKNAVLVNLSQGHYSSEVAGGASLNYSKVIKAINKVPAFSGAGYDAGDPEDPLDDRFGFQFGDYEINIYNLFSIPDCRDENVNSLITLITKGEQNMLFLGDINNDQYTGEKLSDFIREDIGEEPIALLKDAHHSASTGSNTRAEADNYRPLLDITSKGRVSDLLYGNSANFQYYCEQNFGTKFYMAGDAEVAFVADVLDDEIKVSQLLKSGKTSAMPVSECNIPDGWRAWDYGRSTGNDTEHGGRVFYYFENNEPASGWKYINDKWYYFSDGGQRQTGWITVDGKKYYMNGAAVLQTGWKKIGGKWYYFNTSGDMKTGWFKDKGKWYYLQASGIMAADTSLTIDGKKYSFNSSGVWIRK